MKLYEKHKLQSSDFGESLGQRTGLWEETPRRHQALHVNGLWANGIPFNPGLLPVGTVFAMPFGVAPVWALPTTGVLWIA